MYHWAPRLQQKIFQLFKLKPHETTRFMPIGHRLASALASTSPVTSSISIPMNLNQETLRWWLGGSPANVATKQIRLPDDLKLSLV